MQEKQSSNRVLYNHEEVEKKWRKRWEESGIYKTPEKVTKENKCYILPQLPYPSGSGLHVGHAEVYSACDIVARFKRMRGKKVLQVIGWDAFGLPAENYAIKTNVHPRINTDQAIGNFREQIKKMGVSVDWDREVGSHNSDYYKWTQWFFLLMYNQGLAYRKNQKVNWCPSCKTVLANEQVVTKDGVEVCERCDTPIEHKMMEQWYLKITEYADRLAKDLDNVDWPAETVKRQRDWIGRSEGAEVSFPIAGAAGQKDRAIKVFTTRPDTIFGATYLVLAPEHEMVEALTTADHKSEVDKYVAATVKKQEIERTDMTKEKTGVFTGSYAINPLTNEEIPIWIADYVLTGYGTGAIMAVPAHDERDGDFAKKFDLAIKEVVTSISADVADDKNMKPFTGKGKVVNSGEFDGMTTDEAKEAIIKWLENKGLGQKKVTYKLRDWSVSRQRFWGAPIPMLHKQLNKVEADLEEVYAGKPNLFINFHAWYSSPISTYHPWIEEQLKENDIEVVSPDLPNDDRPDLNVWLETVEKAVKDTKIENLKNAVVSGRSLGAWAALKFVESHKIRKLILVAPTVPTKRGFEAWKEYADDEDMYNTLVEFIGGEKGNVDFEKVKNNVDEIVFMQSKDDPYLNLEQSEEFLRSKFPFLRTIRFRDANHFTKEAGFEKFPKLLEEILAEVRLDLKPVTVDDLPVILPDDVDFKPTGQSPLTYSEDFQKGVEEKYGEGFSREPDTLDTFMCSSWYYFRYLDPHNDKAFASEEALKEWMPVDFYLGGPEHVNGHLLYSRFFTKVLFDAGYIDFDEPFAEHRHQGLILGEDHRKMSKRWGNVVNPSDVADEHGADTLRMYEMFMGPLSETKPWSSKGVMGIRRFLNKVWNLQEKVGVKLASDETYKKQQVEINKLIKKVTEDLESLSFNTSIAKMMEFVNIVGKDEGINTQVWEKFLLVLAPFSPFITEELYEQLKGQGKESIHMQKWPEFDEKLLQTGEDKIVVVQINGKVRDKLTVPVGSSQQEVEILAKKSEKVMNYLSNAEIKKVIYVKDKLISFVV